MTVFVWCQIAFNVGVILWMRSYSRFLREQADKRPPSSGVAILLAAAMAASACVDRGSSSVTPKPDGDDVTVIRDRYWSGEKGRRSFEDDGRQHDQGDESPPGRPVPEPTTVVLVASGAALLGLAGAVSRRRRR